MDATQRKIGWIGQILAMAPGFLAAAAGVVIWEIFRPGFLCLDDVGQMRMAVGEKPYTDWYSVLLPLSMAWALKAGYGISVLTLLQSIAGSVGVYWMSSEVLRFLTRNRLPDWQMRWAGLGVFAMLLTPFTPLMYYLAHYKNDTLAAVFLTSAVAGWLRVERVWNTDPLQASRVRRLLVLLPAAAASIMAIEIRHNVVVTLPVFLGFVALAVGRSSRMTAAVTGVALIIAPLVLNEGLMRLAGAVRAQPVRQIMALDLVGMCVEREDLRSKLRYTSKNLIGERYRTGYVPGVVTTLFPGKPEPDRIVSESYVFGDFRPLSREYRRAIKAAPGTWLTVKAKAAIASLFDQAPHWHHRVIDPNPFGIAFRDDLRNVRSVLLTLNDAVFADPVLRFLCARHLPWLVLDIILVVLAGIAVGLSRTRASVLRALLLLLPLAYYVSHLVAVAAHEYRYMFPATLLLQILVVCGTLQTAARWMHAHVARLKVEEHHVQVLSAAENGNGALAVTPPMPGAVKRPSRTFVSLGRDQ